MYVAVPSIVNPVTDKLLNESTVTLTDDCPLFKSNVITLGDQVAPVTNESTPEIDEISANTIS
jgi:hypothetical protein